MSNVPAVSLPNGKASGHAKQASRNKSLGLSEKPLSPIPQINWQLGVPGQLQDEFLEVKRPCLFQVFQENASGHKFAYLSSGSRSDA